MRGKKAKKTSYLYFSVLLKLQEADYSSDECYLRLVSSDLIYQYFSLKGYRPPFSSIKSGFHKRAQSKAFLFFLNQIPAFTQQKQVKNTEKRLSCNVPQTFPLFFFINREKNFSFQREYSKPILLIGKAYLMLIRSSKCKDIFFQTMEPELNLI